MVYPLLNYAISGTINQILFQRELLWHLITPEKRTLEGVAGKLDCEGNYFEVDFDVF